jgi:hypothetical protein
LKETFVKRIAIICMCLFLAGLLALAAWKGRTVSVQAGASNYPAYTSEGKLVLPANYREWVFLTSGFGMNYSTGPVANPMFTNVYVAPEAYQSFKAAGAWPDKSVFIVEIYSPASRGSINKAGHYQDSFRGLDVEVKDSARPQQWSYYNFNPGATTAAALGEGCNRCHSDNAAVEHTFVQFYPTLLDFAVEKHLIKPNVSIPLNQSRFLKLMDNAGWQNAEQAYYEDRKRNPDSDLLDQAALDALGYNLLGAGKTTQAISVLELAAKNYPASTNAYESLGDAYAVAEQAGLAVAASQKELALAQSDSSLSADQKQQFTALAQKRIAAMNKR